MRTAVYPGSFDPVTLGHYDIIERTAKMVDKLIIGVLNNKAKCPLFSAQERVNMLKEVTASLPNVEIQSFEGLLIDFVRGSHADTLSGDCGPLRILNTSFRWRRPTGSLRRRLILYF